MQVDRVELGLARCDEKSTLVTKVMPELAQCPAISLAQVWVPYQSFDSHCLLFPVLNPLVGFAAAIKRLVFDTVKERTGGAQLYD